MSQPSRVPLFAAGKTARLAIAGLALAAVGAGAWWWRHESGSRIAFRTATLRRGDVAESITATGTVEPVEVVDVGAQVEGQIRSFGTDKNGKPVDYGSVVEQGTVLARIDDSVYAADLALAEAQVQQALAAEVSAAAGVAQAKAKAEQAAADWKRAEELGPSEALAQSAFDSYKAAYAIAQADVSLADGALGQAKASTVQARAALEKARRNLAFCTIRSPVAGVIIDRRVNIGQTVVSSLSAPSLFLIARDLRRMQIWVGVNEADIARISPGDPVTYTCDAFPGRQFAGVVGKKRLNATMTQNVVMYTVEVNTDNTDQVLLPYLTATVRFVVRKDSDALLVPNAAFRWLPSSLAEVAPQARSWRPADPAADGRAGRKGTIWVKDGDFVRPVEAALGATDGTATAVSGEGLREGEEIVIAEDSRRAGENTRNPFLPSPYKR